MENLSKVEGPLKKIVRKEPRLEMQLRPFPSPAKETAEEKNLREIGIIESTKQRLSKDADYYETQDGGAGVFKQGKGCLNERAAYVVDKFLGFGLVPVTVIRNVGEKVGSFQRFISDAKTGFEVSREQVPTGELVKMVLLDFVNNNVDRNEENILIKKKRLFAPDNKDSFSTKHIYPPVYFGEEFFSTPIPEEIRDKIIQFEKRPVLKESLSKSLEKLLEKDEGDAFFKRLEHLIQYAKRGYFQSEEEYEKFEKQAKVEYEKYIKKFIENNKLTEK